MPDFAGLRAVAEDAVRQPEFAEIVRRAGRVRRRNWTTLGVGGVAAAAVAAIVAGQVLAGPSRSPGPAAPPDSSTTDRWVNIAVGSASRLYALVSTCTYPESDATGEGTCDNVLRVSEDAGRIWYERALPAERNRAWVSLTAIGPGLLYGYTARHVRVPMIGSPLPTDMPGSPLPTDIPPSVGAPSPTAPLPTDIPPSIGAPSPTAPPPPAMDLADTSALQISTDGGLTWRDATISSTPIPAVPAGGAAVACQLARRDPTAGCPVSAIDPATGTIAPLATQPPIRVALVPDVPASAGVWVTGWDTATGRPAASVSRDGGRTWTTKVVDIDATGDTTTNGGASLGPVPAVVARDRTACLAVNAPDGARSDNGYRQQVFRTTDGGTSWQAIGTASPLAFITPDGACVATADINPSAAPKVKIYQASRDGGPFAPFAVTGIPPAGGTIATADDGSLFATNKQDAIYLSTDGSTFRTVDLP